MRALSASELLNIWELGQSQTLPQRALLLLAVGCPDIEPGRLEEISIGRRDAILLDFRELIFGEHLACLVACPACGDRLEITMHVSDVRTTGSGLPGDRSGDGEDHIKLPEARSIHIADYSVEFRPLNSRDLIMIAGPPIVENPRRFLLERCFLNITRDKERISVDDLPEDIVASVAEEMERDDPQADVQLSLICPSCKHQWLTMFDIVSFLWNELSSWAVRLLHEVHVLAQRYGWSEKDILNLSSFRRRFYLEMATR